MCGKLVADIMHRTYLLALQKEGINGIFDALKRITGFGRGLSPSSPFKIFLELSIKIPANTLGVCSFNHMHLAFCLLLTSPSSQTLSRLDYLKSLLDIERILRVLPVTFPLEQYL